MFYQGATTDESFPMTFLRRWFPAVYFEEVNYAYRAFCTQVTDAGLAYICKD